MPEIVTECPHCHSRHRVEPRLEGQTVACPHCSQPFRVVEHITQPKQYRATRDDVPDPQEDEVLAPPVVTPSWRETPILRTSFSGDRASAAIPSAGPAQEPGTAMATSIEPDQAPSYWGLRLASVFHTYAGGLAILIGLVVLVSGLQTSPPGEASPGAISRDALYCWGLLLLFCGIISVTLGRTLVVVRRMAQRGVE